MMSLSKWQKRLGISWSTNVYRHLSGTMQHGHVYKPQLKPEGQINTIGKHLYPAQAFHSASLHPFS